MTIAAARALLTAGRYQDAADAVLDVAARWGDERTATVSSAYLALMLDGEPAKVAERVEKFIELAERLAQQQ
jgi:hypothetical protein